MQNGRFTFDDTKIILDSIATHFQGLLHIENNQVFLEEKPIGKITINGCHNTVNFISFWHQIVLSLLEYVEGDDHEFEILLCLVKKFFEVLPKDCHHTLILLVKQKIER